MYMSVSLQCLVLFCVGFLSSFYQYRVLSELEGIDQKQDQSATHLQMTTTHFYKTRNMDTCICIKKKNIYIYIYINGELSLFQNS